jgi:adenine deaminase
VTRGALARRIAVARGDEPADLVVRGGHVLSVFTREWLDADVAVCDGHVAGVGDYEGREVLDASGRCVVPGSDLERFVPYVVLKAGHRIETIPRSTVPEWVKNTVHIQPVSANDFRVPWQGGRARVIGLIPDQVVTDALVEELRASDGLAIADPERDLAKIAVIERHLGTGRTGLGFVRGFGLRSGALASTVAHDAHNIVVVGVENGDMARAVQRLGELGGGIVAVDSRGVSGQKLRCRSPASCRTRRSPRWSSRAERATRQRRVWGARSRHRSSRSPSWLSR